MKKSYALAAAALLGACATDGADTGSAGASAELMNAAGARMASASVSQQGDGLRVRVQAAGLRPGTYGVHLHMVGRCDPPGFESAGGHWNPTERKHGTMNPQGPHQGDLPNLSVGANGEGGIDFVVPGARLAGLLDADGASVMVHAAADDYRTDPSGNSGARIACGRLG